MCCRRRDRLPCVFQQGFRDVDDDARQPLDRAGDSLALPDEHDPANLTLRIPQSVHTGVRALVLEVVTEPRQHLGPVLLDHAAQDELGRGHLVLTDSVQGMQPTRPGPAPPLDLVLEQHHLTVGQLLRESHSNLLHDDPEGHPERDGYFSTLPNYTSILPPAPAVRKHPEP